MHYCSPEYSDSFIPTIIVGSLGLNFHEVCFLERVYVIFINFARVVFVDAGIAPIDLETKRMKEELRLKEVQARAVAEHGELALISVDGPKADTNERVSFRPPMLQVYCFLQLCMLPLDSKLIVFGAMKLVTTYKDNFRYFYM